MLTLLIGCCCRKASFGDDHTEADEVEHTIFFNPDDPIISKTYHVTKFPTSVSICPPFSEERQTREKPPKKRFEPEFYDDMVKTKNQEHEMRIVVRDMIVYFCYIAIILIISYGNRDLNAYLAKAAMQKVSSLFYNIFWKLFRLIIFLFFQAVIFGGVNCDTLATDDLRYKPCKPGQVPIPYVNFDKVRDVNEWYYWLDNTLIPNVRVQPWYNGKQPYGLRGYLDDRVNRILGYAIVRQVREEQGTCHTAKIIRGTVESCTGNGGISTEDDRDYCLGWTPKTHPNCTQADEFE